jgi:ABC-2 type transport system ATP-binding protein
MTAIQTEGLTKRFGEDVLAVDDLDLVVESGEVFGFLGPNGAGKSTTINMLLGFLRPTAGSVEVLGMEVAGDSRPIRQRLGLLPEGWEPYENLTGREHVESAIHAKDASDDPAVLLDRVGLDEDAWDRRAGTYSTGMQQRMSLAVALVGDPDLLILDEPSSGLDPDGVSLLRDIIREEADRGASVFFCSHILEEVEKVCDRVGILNEGSLVALDTIDNLRGDMRAGATVTAQLDAIPSDLAVADVEGVREVTYGDDGVVTVEVGEAAAKMRTLRYLDAHATVQDVSIEDASLEALFDEYTNGGGPAGSAASSAEESAADGASSSDADGASSSDATAEAEASAAPDGGESS